MKTFTLYADNYVFGESDFFTLAIKKEKTNKKLLKTEICYLSIISYLEAK